LPAGHAPAQIPVVLSALLFAFSLEGLLPGAIAARRPIPVVWFDRVREPRHRLNLRAIASLLCGHGWREPEAADATADLTRGSRSAAGSTGWVSVFLRER
jgi:hypothetical protein